MTIRRHSSPKRKGLVIEISPVGIVETDTMCCVHCGGHWMIRPGSGIERGFCFKCNGPICGRDCEKCVPMEKMLEVMEGSRTGTETSVSLGWVK